jgi:hypothetical protein
MPYLSKRNLCVLAFPSLYFILVLPFFALPFLQDTERAQEKKRQEKASEMLARKISQEETDQAVALKIHVS